MNQLRKIGRLAFRVEGDTWRAYYALTETMDGAIPLGSVAMRFVQTPARRDQFIAFMREAVADLIEESTGTRPQWPDPPQRAPEHERSGSA
jgi:hypothetical protein